MFNKNYITLFVTEILFLYITINDVFLNILITKIFCQRTIFSGIC